MARKQTKTLAETMMAKQHDVGVVLAYRVAEAQLRTARDANLRIAADGVKRAAAAEILRRGLSLR